MGRGGEGPVRLVLPRRLSSFMGIARTAVCTSKDFPKRFLGGANEQWGSAACLPGD